MDVWCMVYAIQKDWVVKKKRKSTQAAKRYAGGVGKKGAGT